MNELDQWITAKEAAGMLGISPTALAQRRSRARFDPSKRHPHHVSLGNQTLYLLSSVEASVRDGA